MSRNTPQLQPKAHGKLQTESPLSPYRTFVVQFRAETSVTRKRYAGRVGYVVSGQAPHFASLEELLVFIGRVLANKRVPPHKRGRSGG